MSSLVNAIQLFIIKQRHLTGLASPKCREMFGASGESVQSITAKASVGLMSTFTKTSYVQSLASGVIALVVLLVIALIVIGVLVYKIRTYRGNFS